MSFTSRELVKKLIEAYQRNPVLYDIQCAGYKNKNKRHECLTNIVEELAPYAILSTDEIKKKINGLRTQYFNELAKEKKSQTSGTGTGEIYKSSWWCFECLNFLRTSAPVRKGESNLCQVQTSTTSEVIETDADELIYDGPTEELQDIDFGDMLSPTSSDITRPSTSNTLEPPEPAPKKRKRSDYSAQDILSKATAALEQAGQTTEDHLDAFGQLIASEMRRIKNKKSVTKLKRSILNQIYDVIDEENV